MDPGGTISVGVDAKPCVPDSLAAKSFQILNPNRRRPPRDFFTLALSSRTRPLFPSFRCAAVSHQTLVFTIHLAANQRAAPLPARREGSDFTGPQEWSGRRYSHRFH
jgi:hypothetical protein